MIPTKTINLDFWRYPTEVLNLVQGESAGRTLRFNLVDGTDPFDLTSATSAWFAVRKSDETVSLDNAVIIDAVNGIVEVTFSSQSVAAAGDAIGEIQIMTAESLTKSFNIPINIQQSVDTEGISPSVTEFGVLTDLVNDVSGWQQTLSDLDDRVDTIITTPAESVSAQEIIDARDGAATLGSRIDAIEATVDVEQGTFTPVYEAETGMADITMYATGGTFYAVYYRIGKIVNFSLRMAALSVSIGDASGNLRITGLPFLPNQPTYLSPPRLDRMNYELPVNTWVTAILSPSGYITIDEQRASAIPTALPITVLKENVSNSNFVVLTGTFTIA